MLPEDSPIFGLIRQVREGGYSVSEYGVTIASPKIGTHFVSIDAAALSDRPGSVVVSVHELSIARKIDPQLVTPNAARSVTPSAAKLAHGDDRKRLVEGKGGSDTLNPGAWR